MSRIAAWWIWPQTTPSTSWRLASSAERRLEGADEIDRILDLELGPGRERPVAEAEGTPAKVEISVQEERQVIGPITEKGEPFGIAHDDVEFVAMDDQEAPSVGRRMDDAIDEDDAAEGQADILAGEFIMIARHIDDARALADLAQELLDHVVVRPAANTSRI